MGRVCEKHQQFVQDGDTCRYCPAGEVWEGHPGYDLLPVRAMTKAELGLSDESISQIAFDKARGTPLTDAIAAELITHGHCTVGNAGYYTAYDLLPVTSVPDSVSGVPAARQRDGRLVAGRPAPPPDPSIREHLRLALEDKAAREVLDAAARLEALDEKRANIRDALAAAAKYLPEDKKD